ncbi:endoglucanase-like [Diorhabda carinulata]|uniref:endoglucanase-like n=1 Tax=Diorhabda carinulata TaxID=1163345 RepID=UPI0025A252FF|nr:endoglucanase-like [Diorhabda carinulata]
MTARTFLILFALLSTTRGEQSPDIIPVDGGVSGNGITTRYWDCCKASCSWVDNIDTPDQKPVNSCLKDGETIAPITDYSGCGEGGTAFTCNNNQPFLVNSTLSYGFAAASFTGGLDYSMCCACVLLSFEGQLKGKQFLVQVTNSGETLSVNQFDLDIPGGGVGIYPQGCMAQWNAPETGWGEPYGGVSSIEECDELPDVLQGGCRWRFEFMEGVSNPNVTFYQVKCPKELIDISGCQL